MFESVWSALLHPSNIVGRDGAGDLALAAVVVAFLNLALMAIAGRRIAKRSPVIAVLGGFAFLPLLINALAFLLAWNAPEGGDGEGMLVAAALVLSICALPVTLTTSLLCICIRRRLFTH